MNGERQYLNCRNFSGEEVSKWLHLLTTQASNSDGVRLRKLQHTDFPSIQGPWTPFTFKDPALNLAQFPDHELSKPLHQPKTATSKLLELYKEQKEKQKIV